MSFMKWCASMVLMLFVVAGASIAIMLLFSGGWGTAAMLFGGYCIYKHYEDKP